jgi:MarR family transcriptional repressor of emrRAB
MMHIRRGESPESGNSASPAARATPAGQAARTSNLLGALALEAARVQEEATRAAVGQAGAATAALVVIAASPGRTIEQIRGPLGLSQPGAARLIERLAQEGWIDRGGPGGRRGLQISLTAAGVQVFDELLVARRAVLWQLLEPLSGPELAQLSDLFEKLLAARTGDRADLERLCRVCERRVCSHCPVGHALDAMLPDG